MNKKREDIKQLIETAANNIESIREQPCGEVEVTTRSGTYVTVNDLLIIADCYLGESKPIIYTESIKSNRTKFIIT